MPVAADHPSIPHAVVVVRNSNSLLTGFGGPGVAPGHGHPLRLGIEVPRHLKMPVLVGARAENQAVVNPKLDRLLNAHTKLG